MIPCPGRTSPGCWGRDRCRHSDAGAMTGMPGRMRFAEARAGTRPPRFEVQVAVSGLYFK